MGWRTHNCTCCYILITSPSGSYSTPNTHLDRPPCNFPVTTKQKNANTLPAGPLCVIFSAAHSRAFNLMTVTEQRQELRGELGEFACFCCQLVWIAHVFQSCPHMLRRTVPSSCRLPQDMVHAFDSNHLPYITCRKLPGFASPCSCFAAFVTPG